MKFTKGQKAKIAGKSTGYQLKDTPLKVGERVEIWGVDEKRKFYIVRKAKVYWFFKESDLEETK